jgi:uncharacterized SAM-binding protein YcdF (DUF218 family)
MPLTLGLLLLWIGLVFRRRLRFGAALALAGVLGLTVLSFQPVADEVIKRLEVCYPPLLNSEAARQAKWVVVLAGGHFSNPERPPTLQIGSASLARLVEGLRVQALLPGARLLLSGGPVFDPVPEADTLAAVARALKSDIEPVLERDSRDTGEQARFIRTIVRDDPMVLVTSAIHMPRAMLLFQQQGMNPVAAPAEVADFSHSPAGPFPYVPRAAALSRVEAAWHEILGLLWAKLTG